MLMEQLRQRDSRQTSPKPPLAAVDAVGGGRVSPPRTWDPASICVAPEMTLWRRGRHLHKPPLLGGETEV